MFYMNSNAYLDFLGCVWYFNSFYSRGLKKYFIKSTFS